MDSFKFFSAEIDFFLFFVLNELVSSCSNVCVCVCVCVLEWWNKLIEGSGLWWLEISGVDMAGWILIEYIYSPQKTLQSSLTSPLFLGQHWSTIMKLIIYRNLFLYKQGGVCTCLWASLAPRPEIFNNTPNCLMHVFQDGGRSNLFFIRTLTHVCMYI
jgi:hypothetical protein